MKIQFICAPNSGISYHRYINPFSYLQLEQGDKAEMLWDGDNSDKIDGDILMYNKYCRASLDHLKGLQAKGLKIIVDVDDYWVLPSSHPNFAAWERNQHSLRIAEHIKNADLVTCTTVRLQNKVRELNKNTVVIPNAFPFGHENYKPMPIENTKMVFMYMGSSTHLPDVRLMEGKFKRIGSDAWLKSNSIFILAGYEKAYAKRFFTEYDKAADNTNYIKINVRGDYDKMRSVFMHTGSYGTYNSTNQDEYINYYDRADVALIPLCDTEWNSYKSPLKVTEAGVKAIPAIVSKVEPYWPELKDVPGILWVEGNDWLTPIRKCAKDKVMVKELGQQLLSAMKEKYDLDNWNKVRLDVIKSLI